ESLKTHFCYCRKKEKFEEDKRSIFKTDCRQINKIIINIVLFMVLLPPLRGPPPSKMEAPQPPLLSQNFTLPLTKPPLRGGVGGRIP
ncbi:MAG: hypothetical protein IKN43_06585, partial [Selenomonadaceae bacterium]|nr:hypothetical protein [Selenomonadaceae bacterium]